MPAIRTRETFNGGWAAIWDDPKDMRIWIVAEAETEAEAIEKLKAGTVVLSTVDELPFFLSAETLKPFIPNDLGASTSRAEGKHSKLNVKLQGTTRLPPGGRDC